MASDGDLKRKQSRRGSDRKGEKHNACRVKGRSRRTLMLRTLSPKRGKEWRGEKRRLGLQRKETSACQRPNPHQGTIKHAGRSVELDIIGKSKTQNPPPT